jgi:hypothetical protein
MEAQPSLVDNCPSNKTTGVPLLKSKPPLYPKYQILASFWAKLEIVKQKKKNVNKILFIKVSISKVLILLLLCLLTRYYILIHKHFKPEKSQDKIFFQ